MNIKFKYCLSNTKPRRNSCTAQVLLTMKGPFSTPFLISRASQDAFATSVI